MVVRGSWLQETAVEFNKIEYLKETQTEIKLEMGNFGWESETSEDSSIDYMAWKNL